MQFDYFIGSFDVDVFAELCQHFDGGAYLSGGRCLHNQMRMPREGVCARVLVGVLADVCEATVPAALLLK